MKYQVSSYESLRKPSESTMNLSLSRSNTQTTDKNMYISCNYSQNREVLDAKLDHYLDFVHFDNSLQRIDFTHNKLFYLLCYLLIGFVDYSVVLFSRLSFDYILVKSYSSSIVSSGKVIQMAQTMFMLWLNIKVLCKVFNYRTRFFLSLGLMFIGMISDWISILILNNSNTSDYYTHAQFFIIQGFCLINVGVVLNIVVIFATSNQYPKYFFTFWVLGYCSEIISYLPYIRYFYYFFDKDLNLDTTTLIFILLGWIFLFILSLLMFTILLYRIGKNMCIYDNIKNVQQTKKNLNSQLMRIKDYLIQLFLIKGSNKRQVNIMVEKFLMKNLLRRLASNSVNYHEVIYNSQIKLFWTVHFIVIALGVIWITFYKPPSTICRNVCVIGILTNLFFLFIFNMQMDNHFQFLFDNQNLIIYSFSSLGSFLYGYVYYYLWTALFNSKRVARDELEVAINIMQMSSK